MFRLTSILLICFSFSLIPQASATLVNGDFASGLTGWDVAGGASTVSGAAQLDDNTGTADLTQAFLLAPGLYSFSFDFNAGGLASAPLFDDLFTATYYSLDAPGGVLPSDPVAAAIDIRPLLDLTAEGSVLYGGSLLALGGDWFRYQIAITQTASAGFIEFLLTGFDATDGNSALLLDNVSFDQAQAPVIPEPLHLGVLGLLLAGGLRRRLGR